MGVCSPKKGGSPVLAEGLAARFALEEGGVLLPVDSVQCYVSLALLPVVLAVLIGAEELFKIQLLSQP
ncbi:MAG: hypothetical protein Q6367_015980 [Candidatus Freyarchaeota archaeon]